MISTSSIRRNRGTFKEKGQEILSQQQPTSLGEFLGSPREIISTESVDSLSPLISRGEAVNADMTQNQNNGNPGFDTLNPAENRQTGNPTSRHTRLKAETSQRMVREEFRLTPSLSERFNTYVFDQKKIRRRTSKTDVVHEALEAFLTAKGY
jgi:hypothetical protein